MPFDLGTTTYAGIQINEYDLILAIAIIFSILTVLSIISAIFSILTNVRLSKPLAITTIVFSAMSFNIFSLVGSIIALVDIHSFNKKQNEKDNNVIN